MGARNRPNLVKQPVRSTAEPSTPAHQKSSFKVGNREEREGGRGREGKREIMQKFFVFQTLYVRKWEFST